MSEHHDPLHPPHTPDEVQHALVEHDDWFRHSADEPTHQASHGDFNPYIVMACLAVTIAVVVGVIVFTLPWFGRLVQAGIVSVQENNVRYTFEFTDKSGAWHAQLYGEPTWLDEKNNIVRIPIDDAITQVVQEYKAAR